MSQFWFNVKTYSCILPESEQDSYFSFFCLCFFFLFSFVTIAFSMKGNSAQPDSFRVVTIEPKELALGA